MRILRLLLINRKHISGFSHIDIDFSADKHVILGSNGSGKSTLLSELSALPPDAANYNGDGQKSIWFELDTGDVIEFTSYPNQKKHHYVYINDNTDKNINVSGTITEQRELAKKYTGITQVYFDYFVFGQQKFTATKPAFRRTIFDDLNTASYAYVMGVYNRVKSDLKDTGAVIKHLGKRLVALEQERLSDERVTELEATLTQISNELEGWFDLRVKNRRSTKAIRGDMDKVVKASTPATNSLATRFDTLAGMTTVSDVKAMASGYAAAIAAGRARIEELTVELSERKKALQHDSTRRQMRVEAIKELKAELETRTGNKYMAYVSKLDRLPSDDTFSRDVNALYTAVTSLPSDSSQQYTKDASDRLKEEVLSVNNSRRALEMECAEYSAMLKQIEHHKHTDGVTCPSCGTFFVPLLGELTADEVKAKLDEAGALLKDTKSRAGEIESMLMEVEAYLDSRRHAVEKIRALPMVADWWLAHGLSLDAPLKAAGELCLLRDEVSEEYVRREIIGKIKSIEDELSLFQEMSTEYEANLKKEVAVVESELGKHTDALYKVMDQHEATIAYGRALQLRLSKIAEAEKSLADLSDLEYELKLSAYGDFVDAHIESLTSRRNQVFTAVQAARNNADNILKAKKEISESEALLAKLQVLEKALSPTSGVIAEGMFGFINSFVALMNQYVESHWVDPLVITPCAVNETGFELDYLFPVQTLRETPEDVSKCSTGQKEIIDWTFREAGMRGLGLSTHPVLFDEWGVHMDEAHKNSTCELLGGITDRTGHDQVIIISHLKVIHEALGDVRQLVLCDRNVTISGEYNTHAILR